MLIFSFQTCCFSFWNLVFASNLVVTLFSLKSFFWTLFILIYFWIIYFYQFFCVFIFMFIIWVVIILICSWCCCFSGLSFCLCIMVTICWFSPDIGLWLMARSKEKCVFHKGETDVSTPGAAFAKFGADRGSWSCLN